MCFQTIARSVKGVACVNNELDIVCHEQPLEHARNVKKRGCILLAQPAPCPLSRSYAESITRGGSRQRRRPLRAHHWLDPSFAPSPAVCIFVVAILLAVMPKSKLRSHPYGLRNRRHHARHAPPSFLNGGPQHVVEVGEVWFNELPTSSESVQKVDRRGRSRPARSRSS